MKLQGKIIKKSRNKIYFSDEEWENNLELLGTIEADDQKKYEFKYREMNFNLFNLQIGLRVIFDVIIDSSGREIVRNIEKIPEEYVFLSNYNEKTGIGTFRSNNDKIIEFNGKNLRGENQPIYDALYVCDIVENILSEQKKFDKINNIDLQNYSKEMYKISKDDLVEDIIKLEDLVVDAEYPEEEKEMLTRFYDKTMNAITENEIITGRILDITDSDVIIDIGFKSKGIVPKEEFDKIDELKVGDEVEVFLETLDGRQGQPSLSRRKADFIRTKEKNNNKNNELIYGTIIRSERSGIIVNIMETEVLFNSSIIDGNRIVNITDPTGKIKLFKIISIDYTKKTIIISPKIKNDKDLVGKIVTGIVTKVFDFGGFIDIGYTNEGLLHSREIVWSKKMVDARQYLRVGQKIDLIIKRIWTKNGDKKIDLSLKILEKTSEMPVRSFRAMNIFRLENMKTHILDEKIVDIANRDDILLEAKNYAITIIKSNPELYKKHRETTLKKLYADCKVQLLRHLDNLDFALAWPLFQEYATFDLSIFEIIDRFSPKFLDNLKSSKIILDRENDHD